METFHSSNSHGFRFFPQDKYEACLKAQLTMIAPSLEQIAVFGIDADTELKLQFFFYTDCREKAGFLSGALKDIDYALDEVKQKDEQWLITGWTQKIKMDENVLKEWTSEMCAIGFKFDCRYDGWGTHPEQDEAVTIDPKLSLEELNMLAESYYDDKEYRMAQAYCDEIVSREPENGYFYYTRGLVKMARGNSIGALEDFSAAISRSPELEDAYGSRAAAFANIGENEDALKDFNTIIDMNSDNGWAYFNRGTLLMNMGKKDDACIDWAKSKSLGIKEAAEYLEKFR